MSSAIELEDGKPPEWMIALENKQKRQHKLAHEIGAGAPCLNCNDGCSGLDLHFWRKICRNCKCKKEVHDVKEENCFEQFEILFGDSSKGSDRIKQLSLNLKFLGPRNAVNNKNVQSVKSDNDLSFDWIPTDVPENLASEYLQQLPLEKLPITGSAGAMFRRQQLQKQIPLHDFKANNDVTDEEMKAFIEYVDNLKSNAVGKGQITKVLSQNPIPETAGSNPLSLAPLPPPPPLCNNRLNSSPKPYVSLNPTPENNTGEDYDLPPPPAELLNLESGGLHLKTPSAFIPYKQLTGEAPSTKNNINESAGLARSIPYATQNVTYGKFKQSSTPVHELTAQYAEKLALTGKDRDADTENNNNCWYSEGETGAEEAATLTPSEIIRKFNNGGAVASSSSPPPPPPEDSYLNNNNARNVDGKFLKIGKPERFQALSSYVPSMPLVSNTLTNSVAPGVKGNVNAVERNRSPKVHFGPSTTVYLEEDADTGEMEVSAEKFSCHQCKSPICPGQVVVLAERAGVEVMWHPQCFVCVICQELLVDLVYFFHKNEVYCGRHYADVLKIPRCYACDELIFLKEYTVAEGQSFHVKHFCCFECDIPLAGMQYVPKDNNPVCLPCFETKYGKKCHCCKKMIKAGDSRVGWKELNWHASSDCFKCTECSKSLLGGKFVVKNESPLCSKECAMKQQLAVAD